jgi:hypothetical protein
MAQRVEPFVFYDIPDKKQQQTFTIILPNLIHKPKKGNLKR